MPETPALFVGVDGGGTHTRAVVTDGGGQVLGSAQGPAGIVDPGDPGRSAVVVAETVRRALVDALGGGTGDGPPVEAVWAGLAGAGDPAARRSVEEALSALGLAHRVMVGTDLEAAFVDAFGESPGILLVVGTGSVALARGGDGGEARSGGWGGLLGDEGSAYSLGLAAIRAVLRSTDGRSPDTLLSGILEAGTGVGAGPELAAWAWAAAKAEIAALAPGVLSVADAGDPVAETLRDDALSEIGLLLQAVAHRGGPWREPPSVALVGGLVGPGRPLREGALGKVAELGLRTHFPEVRPERGAATLARRSSNR
jgi:N-acetylglucosamine kinase-like BadF-type ATPase